MAMLNNQMVFLGLVQFVCVFLMFSALVVEHPGVQGWILSKKYLYIFQEPWYPGKREDKQK